jgi:antitoxin VapB
MQENYGGNMPPNIKDEDTHKRAKELARLTHTSMTRAVEIAVSEALERRQSGVDRETNRKIAELRDIAEQTSQLPVRDERKAEEILGYDHEGIVR